MSVYERLGVRPVINARGMNTMAGGSIMPAPVLQAMTEAAAAFVDVGELNRRAGEHIARLLGVPAAHVTSGSAGGMLLAAAAVLAGEDPERIARLPDTTGMRDEIVIQRCARIWYDQALRTAGARLVEVGGDETCTEREVRAAIGPRTAALVYIVSPRLGERGVSADRMAALAHAQDLPLIVDAASTLPPVGHLRRWLDQGADLAIYSGGKGIRGPQDTGLLLGRPDLVRAAAANGAPNAAVGRPCKVSKEAIAGLVAAVELFLRTDHDAEWARHLAEARLIAGAIDGRPGVRTRVEDDRAVWTAPTVLVAIDSEASGLAPEDVRAILQQGEPSIMTRVFQGQLLLDCHCLREGEAAIVARRLREALARVPAAR
ncbi:MAG: L-seryl-tRNA selenium transferase [Candidatus Rokuibacteriota bacterium]|nr:MAG: L-seryl-tRNA selenium transferase [Candidatus Rokubacteria bacterium]